MGLCGSGRTRWCRPFQTLSSTGRPFRAGVLAYLVISGKSETPCLLERLEPLRLADFELATELISEWRLARYYSKKASCWTGLCKRGSWARTEGVHTGQRHSWQRDPYLCRQTLNAEITRITLSRGSSTAEGTTPSSTPPMAAPTSEPAAMMSTNRRFWPSTSKLLSRL